MEAKYPNIELLVYIASEYYSTNDTLKQLYREKLASDRYRRLSFDVDVFSQIWGSTATAFDIDSNGGATFGGSAMTKAYTTVVHEELTDIYFVFIGNKLCYNVANANETFLNDLRDRNLKSLSNAQKLY